MDRSPFPMNSGSIYSLTRSGNHNPCVWRMVWRGWHVPCNSQAATSSHRSLCGSSSLPSGRRMGKAAQFLRAKPRWHQQAATLVIGLINHDYSRNGLRWGHLSCFDQLSIKLVSQASLDKRSSVLASTALQKKNPDKSALANSRFMCSRRRSPRWPSNVWD